MGSPTALCGRARRWGTDVRVVGDGAPVHFKGPAKEIRDVVDIPHQPCPPSSPDLNPIEGCWMIIKEELRAMSVRPTSIDGLWEAIQEIWAEISQETIERMIVSMDESQRWMGLLRDGKPVWLEED